MTRLERKIAELNKCQEYFEAARSQNNLYWMRKNHDRMEALRKEISEMYDEAMKTKTSTVFQVLADKDEMVKNDVYKSLLRISLLADACNEACEIAKEKLAEHGITAFSFQDKVKELARISQEIASVTLYAKRQTLEDFIVDNGTFVDMCIKHADAHIRRKLKI